MVHPFPPSGDPDDGKQYMRSLEARCCPQTGRFHLDDYSSCFAVPQDIPKTLCHTSCMQGSHNACALVVPPRLV